MFTQGQSTVVPVDGAFFTVTDAAEATVAVEEVNPWPMT